MSVIVMKFGGTSVADAARIRGAARRAVAASRDGHQVVMVVSARGKKTDELVGLAAEITDAPSDREMDMLLATGEQESVALMAMAVAAEGAEAISMTGGQIGIRTDSAHTQARIIDISTRRMRDALTAGQIVIAAGFQGIDDEGHITTLGRGGSDTTATALAAVLRADECQIFTDVEGVLSTDPRLVDEARLLRHISYDEMLELASMGAGVMHSRSIEFAKKYRVPVRVRPAHAESEGTLIAAAAEESDQLAPLVTGLAVVKDEVRVGLVGLPDRPGVMAEVFARLAERSLPIDMIVQDAGQDGLAEVSFTVPEANRDDAMQASRQALGELGQGDVKEGIPVSKVSSVGRGMRSHTGVAAHMFQLLSDQEINLHMISTSEIKISVQVDREKCESAVAAVHGGFGLEDSESETPEVGFVLRRGSDEGDLSEREAIEQDVVDRLATMEEIVISEVHLDAEQSRITLRNIPNTPGVAAAVFSAVAEGGILVDMIVQNDPRGVVDVLGEASLSFTVPRRDVDSAMLLVREVVEQWGEATIGYDRDIAMLSVVGIGLRSHTGVGARMFRALADAGINIQMINTSEIRISVVVSLEDGAAAHKCLSGVFGL